MKTPLSPLDIEVLIWCHCRPISHPNMDAPAVKESILMWQSSGIIESLVGYPGLFQTTDKGCAMVKALCHTPEPNCKTQLIQRSKLITYRWWCPGEYKIKPEHIQALEERANERIAEMMAQGYTSGNLTENIYMTSNDPEDGVEYSGWWEVNESQND